MADKCDPIRSTLQDLTMRLEDTIKFIKDPELGGHPVLNPEWKQLNAHVTNTRVSLQACEKSLAFHPPYLRSSVPAELEKIQDLIETLREKSYAKKPKNSTVGKRTPAMPQDVSKTTQLEVIISPKGEVPMGFNCKEPFEVTNNFGCDEVYWTISFRDPITGLYDNSFQYLGSSIQSQTTDKVSFEIDQSTYFLYAILTSGRTSATFRINCQGYNYGVYFTTVPSDDVILNFNKHACIGLHSISLSGDTFVGGDNGSEPTMTVTLDAPAPPGGQRVNLSVSDSDSRGCCHFVING